MEHTTKQHQQDVTPHRAPVRVTGWENIREPGFYVSSQTGKGYRITQESLIPGASPAIGVTGAEREMFTRLSNDPYLTLSAARLISADNDVECSF